MKNFCLFLWRMLYPLLLYQVIVEIVFLGFFLAAPETEGQWEIQLQAAGAIAAAVPMMILYRNYRKRRIRALEYDQGVSGVRPEPFGHTGGCGISAVVSLAKLGICLCALFNSILLEFPFSWDSYEEISEILYEPPVLVQIICVGLIVPLAEELVFRGLGYYKMRSMLPALPCILISAAYFGVFHGNLVQGIYAGVLGMVLAGVMEWYGTLKAPYVVHAAANVMSVVMSNTLIGGLLGAFRPVRLIVIALCVIWLIVILKQIRRDGILT